MHQKKPISTTISPIFHFMHHALKRKLGSPLNDRNIINILFLFEMATEVIALKRPTLLESGLELVQRKNDFRL